MVEEIGEWDVDSKNNNSLKNNESPNEIKEIELEEDVKEKMPNDNFQENNNISGMAPVISQQKRALDLIKNKYMNQINIKKDSTTLEKNKEEKNININKNNNILKPVEETVSKNQKISPINMKEDEITNSENVSNLINKDKKFKNNSEEGQEKYIKPLENKKSKEIENDQNKGNTNFNNQNQVIEKNEFEINDYDKKGFKNPTEKKNDGKDTDSEDSIGDSKIKKDQIPERLRINGNFLPISTPPSNLSQTFFASLFNENNTIEHKKEILMKPVPPSAGNLLFTVRRISQTFHGTKFELYSSDNLNFLLKSKRINGSISHNYIISLDQINLSKSSPGSLGLVESNMMGTRYNIFDSGENPDNAKNSQSIRVQHGCVFYDTNLYGSKGPRRMKIIIPTLDQNGEPFIIRPKQKKETFSKLFVDKKLDKLLILYNKQPQWSKAKCQYLLDFRNRVTEASVKNFQISESDDSDYIMIQFGKVDKESFHLDVCYPFSIFQAFAIAVTSLDFKLGTE